jgi:SAM-dependent methyltransferase
MRSATDPALVREQYAREDRLRARRALYEEVTGENAPDVLWRILEARRPRSVLEVGGGPGELAERIVKELGADLVFVDQSERMVDLARRRDLDARAGDVRALPFADGSFDVVVAAWMLYHVDDIDRALAEIARVLTADGALFAATNSVHHLSELGELIAMDVGSLVRQFSRENGEELLRRHFGEVDRIDVEIDAIVRDRAKLVGYQQSLSTPSRPVPEDVPLPFVVHGRSSIFIATR